MTEASEKNEQYCLPNFPRVNRTCFHHNWLIVYTNMIDACAVSEGGDAK